MSSLQNVTEHAHIFRYKQNDTSFFIHRFGKDGGALRCCSKGTQQAKNSSLHYQAKRDGGA